MIEFGSETSAVRFELQPGKGSGGHSVLPHHGRHHGWVKGELHKGGDAEDSVRATPGQLGGQVGQKNHTLR